MKYEAHGEVVLVKFMTKLKESSLLDTNGEKKTEVIYTANTAYDVGHKIENDVNFVEGDEIQIHPDTLQRVINNKDSYIIRSSFKNETSEDGVITQEFLVPLMVEDIVAKIIQEDGKDS